MLLSVEAIAKTRPALKGSRSFSLCPRCARARARGRVSVWACSGGLALQSRRPHRRAVPASPGGRLPATCSPALRPPALSLALRAPALCGEAPRTGTCRSGSARRSPAGAGFACNGRVHETRSHWPWRGLSWPGAALSGRGWRRVSRLSVYAPSVWWASLVKAEGEQASASGSRRARFGEVLPVMRCRRTGCLGTGHLTQAAQGPRGSGASGGGGGGMTR